MFSIVEENMKNKSYSFIELFFRSLVFSVFSVTAIFIYSSLCFLAGVLRLPLSRRHAVMRAFLNLNTKMFAKICRVNYVIEGIENAKRVGVVMSKHQSTWETFYLPTLMHNPAIILKRELLWVPFFGWGLAASNPISINRSDKKGAMQQVVEKGRKALDEGRSILVFPEGTRVPVGKVGHYKLGGARLATETGYPIIPVAHNAGYVWPRRKFIKYPGTIHVVIGKPIETKGLGAEAALRLTKEWIESTVKRIGH